MAHWTGLTDKEEFGYDAIGAEYPESILVPVLCKMSAALRAVISSLMVFLALVCSQNQFLLLSLYEAYAT